MYRIVCLILLALVQNGNQIHQFLVRYGKHIEDIPPVQQFHLQKAAAPLLAVAVKYLQFINRRLIGIKRLHQEKTVLSHTADAAPIAARPALRFQRNHAAPGQGHGGENAVLGKIYLKLLLSPNPGLFPCCRRILRRILPAGLPVRQADSRYRQYGCYRQNNDTNTRFFVLQHMPHPLSRSRFSKSRHIQGLVPSACRIGQQGQTVIIPYALPHLFQHILVTAHLHIPLHAAYSHPYKGIVPINHLYDAGQQTNPQIAMPDMILFVEQHILPLPLFHMAGNIYSAMHRSHGEGRADILALINAAARAGQAYRAGHLPAYPAIGVQLPGSQENCPCQPEPRQPPQDCAAQVPGIRNLCGLFQIVRIPLPAGNL